MSSAYSSEHINGYSPQGSHTYQNGPQHHPSMDRQGEYAQPDQSSAAPYSQGQDVKFNPPAATPTSEYSLNPSSARSSHFPQYQEQRYQNSPANQANPATANMAQSTSPSMPLTSGPPSDQNHANIKHNSNTEVPVDPSIAASSPTYPQPQQQHHYAPYGHPEMPHYQAPPGIYPRPGEYPPPGYAHPHAMPGQYAHVPGQSPPMIAGRGGPPGAGQPLSTVYSFVPIPGTHQQKRPRRRYEEIERMYKCGWNGCEKAYGTLNHLNAHVTMQGHGAKRTPEEFKEIRKEWKQRKKEEENARKVEEERQRQQAAQQGGPQVDSQNNPDGPHSASGGYPQGVQRQLPPLGYAPAGTPGQVSNQYGQPVDGMPQYSGPPVQSYYPQSPYGHANQMYPGNHAPTNGHEQAVTADTQ